ncbi:MAG: Ig-like domain-containing protein [Muribaculaceae bacterium]|nr:Ig-like domain-containing protein [Muribaculaceae bacterium]
MKKSILTTAFALMAGMALAQQPHVYINPGHGGHGSDDRNVVIPPFAAGDTLGFWESNSNLWKGFALQETLRRKGYRTSISRLKNQEANDLNLSTIVALCNSSGADVFYSIHSNASGYGDSHAFNYPMGIYRGYTGQPQVPNSDKLAADLGETLIENQSTVWTNGGRYIIYGDWTFYPDWGLQGLGVLRGNKAVSMLDEGSFHDYYPEAYRLLSHDYDWVEGWNFSIGADRYFGRLDNFDKGVVTGCIRDDRVLREAAYQMVGVDTRVPVDRATVRLLDTNGQEVAVAQTDSLWNGIYLFKYVEPGNYQVEAVGAEHEPMVKPVTVEANATAYCNFDLKKIRNTPPVVLSCSPQWADGDDPLLCNVPVVMQFNWDMDTQSVEQAFTITPQVKGHFTWEDSNYRVTFAPDDAYAANTRYTVTLGAAACHGGGTPMGEDFTITFTTDSRRHLEQLAVFPTQDAQVHLTKLVVEFRTDSLMNPYDLNKHFHVFDSDGNEMTFAMRSVKNNKKSDTFGFIRLPLARDLVPGQDYRLVVDREVADYDGIHIPDTLHIGFHAVDAALQLRDGGEVTPLGGDDVQATLPGGDAWASLARAAGLLGGKALQVKYDFAKTDATSLRVDLGGLQGPSFAQGDTLAVLLQGDMSFNHLVATTADGLDLPLDVIDFNGWKCARARVDWPGNHRVDGFVLQRPDDARVAKQGTAGTLLIDGLARFKRGKHTDIADVQLRGVSVGPNPATDYLVATADALIQAVELVRLDGVTVARNAANYINVTGIPAGVYLMRVHVNGLTSTHKVMVAK